MWYASVMWCIVIVYHVVCHAAVVIVVVVVLYMFPPFSVSYFVGIHIALCFMQEGFVHSAAAK